MKRSQIGLTLVLAGLITLLSLVGCGPQGISASKLTQPYPDGTNGYNYVVDVTLSGVRCYHQSPTFYNVPAYCSALERDSENRDATTGQICSRDFRHTLFDKSCDDWAPTL